MSIPTITQNRSAAALARIAADNAAAANTLSPRARAYAHRYLRWTLRLDEKPEPPPTWAPAIVELVEGHATDALTHLRTRVDVGAPQRATVVDLGAARHARRGTVA